jgi:hypothetical protein
MRLAPLASTFVILALGFGAMPASAAGIGGFAVRPAQSDSRNPAARAYFIIPANPGSTRREAVVVTNHGSKPLVLEVDPVDGLTGVTSGVVYANRGVPVRGAGAWVTPDVRSVTAPPGGVSHVHFTVKVPQSAVPGDHLAGLALQVAKATKSKGGLSVTMVMRAVVGIELQVPGVAAKRIQISSLALAPLPGTTVPSVVVTLEDVGRKLCQPRLTVAIRGAHTTRHATQTLGTILPGDKIAYPFRWPGALGYGSYAVSAAATHCGPEIAMHGIATYSRSGTRAGQSASTFGATAPLPGASHGWWSWLYGLIVLPALLTAWLLLLLRRRRARIGEDGLEGRPAGS